MIITLMVSWSYSGGREEGLDLMMGAVSITAEEDAEGKEGEGKLKGRGTGRGKVHLPLLSLTGLFFQPFSFHLASAYVVQDGEEEALTCFLLLFPTFSVWIERGSRSLLGWLAGWTDGHNQSIARKGVSSSSSSHKRCRV